MTPILSFDKSVTLLILFLMTNKQTSSCLMQQVQFMCGMIFCHFTPRKPDDLKSWFRTQIHLQHSCKVLFNLCFNSSSSFYFWLHSFWSIWIWILWSKIRFFIPFHRNLILDCNLNDPPLEADHGILEMFIPFDQSIYRSHSWFDYMNCWSRVSR